MCGRFNIISDSLQIRILMDRLGVDFSLPSQYNIAPTEEIPVIRQIDGENELVMMRWWLVPAWAPEPSTKYSMFNARSDKVLQSRAFAGPFKRQRAIIPASNFIEWQKLNDVKQPYCIEPADQTDAFAFAGIWEHWQSREQPELAINSCAIITTDAVASFKVVHDRMPVILQPVEYHRWLSNKTPLEDLMPLLKPRLVTALNVTAVDKRINNARHKSAEDLLEIGESVFIEQWQ